MLILQFNMIDDSDLQLHRQVVALLPSIDSDSNLLPCNETQFTRTQGVHKFSLDLAKKRCYNPIRPFYEWGEYFIAPNGRIPR